MSKFGELGVQSQGGQEKNVSVPAKRVVSALAVQAGAKRGKRLSAVVPNAPMVSMEVMNNNFEEWMKLATDNVSSQAGMHGAKSRFHGFRRAVASVAED